MAHAGSFERCGVALVTNGRCAPLLRHLVEIWLAFGAELAVAGTVECLSPLAGHDQLHLVPFDASPERHGDCIQAALDAVRRPYALVTGDDILPVGPGWSRPLPLVPRAIQSVRLVSVTSQRWGDWAYYDGRHVYNQRYDERRPGTYITGGSQLLSPEVRERVRYADRAFHRAADIGVCRDAESAGFELRPPVPDGPLLIHLDRWPPHPADPERIHVPLGK